MYPLWSALRGRRHLKGVWCPFAVHKPLHPENESEPRITPTQAILHSAVDAPGPTSLFPFFSRLDVNLESHFFVKLDGVIEEYMDTERQADANRFANVRAVSIETEDEGNPDERPWTPAQMASIKRLLDWLFTVHPGIKPQVCPAWDKPGVGWHTMWGAPSQWTPVQKDCPGVVRIKQFKTDLTPWINAWAPEDALIVNDNDKTIIRNIIRQELYGDEGAHTQGLTPIVRREVQAVVEEMLSTPNSVTRVELRELAKLGCQDAGVAP